MNKEELSALKLSELKQLAKEKEIKVNGLKKDEIVNLLMEEIPEEKNSGA